MTLKIDWRTAWLCALISAAFVLASNPAVEMGVNDDFSYTQIALNLARTGHLSYNGWNTPMIGFQAYWAAQFIRFFGFSFTVVRLSTLPFVVGSTLLLYYLAERCRASVARASFFSLFVVLSPLTLPLASSFMTDVPALFFWLLCLTCAVKALDAEGIGGFALWIAGIVATGILGGSVRQIVWLGPPLFIPYVALQRRRGPHLSVAAFNWIASVALAAALSRWFNSQSYTVTLPLIPDQRRAISAIFSNAAGLYTELLVLMIPLMLLCVRTEALRKRRALVVTVALAAIAFASFLVLIPRLDHRFASVPFGYFDANIITAHGIFEPGVEMLGDKPILIPVGLQITLLAGALTLQAICTVALAPILRKSIAKRRRWRVLSLSSPSTASSLQSMIGLFAAAYLIAVISRVIVGLAIDRYILPLMAMAGLALLSFAPRGSVPAFPSRAAWAALIVFAFYGLATTHDYFACSRARLQAATELENAHVPRLAITAGLEYDGWTELTSRGHINDERIINPPDAYLSLPDKLYGMKTSYWFWHYTPTVTPTYFITRSLQPGLAASQFHSTSYSAWLPPSRRQIMIQTIPTSQAIR